MPQSQWSSIKIQRLSEQELIDCDKTNKGCDGGYVSSGFKYSYWMGGILSNDQYPYLNQTTKGTCKRVRGTTGLYPIINYFLSEHDILDVKMFMLYGPVAAKIYAGNWLKNYKSGIANPSECNDLYQNPNHDVMIVGYDSESWIIQNSWGTSWGDKGFFKLSIKTNPC